MVPSATRSEGAVSVTSNQRQEQKLTAEDTLVAFDFGTNASRVDRNGKLSLLELGIPIEELGDEHVTFETPQAQWLNNEALEKILEKCLANDDLSSKGTPELLVAGMNAQTYRMGNIVIKVPRIMEDDSHTKENQRAIRNEASIYRIIGRHHSVSEFLHHSIDRDHICLRYYHKGTLKTYTDTHRSQLSDSMVASWARQMIESICFIHAHGVLHSDLRLDQWLLDDDMNARLSDFDGAAYTPRPELGLEGSSNTNLEKASHYLPRDPMLENNAKSDIFALGSSIYELVVGEAPYQGLDDFSIDDLYKQARFPDVENLPMGNIIMRCWQSRFENADEILHQAPISSEM